MPIGALLHAKVPTLAVPEIDQLLDDHMEMLPGNAWRRAVRKALTFTTVAGDALSKQLSPMIEVGCSAQCRLIFGARRRCSSHDAWQKQQQKRCT